MREDEFRVMAGDLLGVSNENAAWNLVGFDEDATQRTFLRRRGLVNGSTVFADLPRLSDVVDDFTHDTSPTRFSVAAQIVFDAPTTAQTTTVVSTTMTDSSTIGIRNFSSKQERKKKNLYT